MDSDNHLRCFRAKHSLGRAKTSDLTTEYDICDNGSVPLRTAVWAIVFMVLEFAPHGTVFPGISWEFIALTATAGTSQIIATALLVYLFSLRNFAVGTAYARTEAFLTAIIGALFFGEAVVIYGWGAILISVAGVILITIARTGIGGGQLLSLLFDKSTWIGITCGLLFAVASLTMRKATLILGMEDFLFRAALTMIFMLSMQTVAMCAYVLVTNASQYLIVWRNRKVCLLVGITSVMGGQSAGQRRLRWNKPRM